MKTLRICLPIIMVLMAGCTTGSWQMIIEPTLQANALVYEIKSPPKNNLNISFGMYQVTDMNTGQTNMTTASIDLFKQVYVEAGLRDHDITRSSTRATHTYKFKIGNKMTWDAHCEYLTDDLKEKFSKHISASKSWALYTCQYTNADKKPWNLTIVKRTGNHLDVTITNKELLFKANAEKGQFVTSGGKIIDVLGAPLDIGYYWTYQNGIVAATSVKDDRHRVWIDKRNTGRILDVLAMASAGLQIYYAEIVTENRH